MSCDTLRASNGHANYLREIIFSFIPTSACCQKRWCLNFPFEFFKVWNLHKSGIMACDMENGVNPQDYQVSMKRLWCHNLF